MAGARFFTPETGLRAGRTGRLAGRKQLLCLYQTALFVHNTGNGLVGEVYRAENRDLAMLPVPRTGM